MHGPELNLDYAFLRDAEGAPSVPVIALWKNHFAGYTSEDRAPGKIYCDNGGEFQEWLQNHGTKFVHSLPNVPQTNAWEETYLFVPTSVQKLTLPYCDPHASFVFFFETEI